jgi:tetrahydromethanopterin S-methyltransferase subunit B
MKEDEDIPKGQGDGGGFALDAYDPSTSDIHVTKEDHVKVAVPAFEESIDKDDQHVNTLNKQIRSHTRVEKLASGNKMSMDASIYKGGKTDP